MDVLPIIGATFVEAIVALIASTAFFVLLKEHARRRQVFLLLFGGAFLCVGVSFGLLFLSQALYAYGNTSAARFVMCAATFFLAIKGGFLILAAVAVYAKRRWVPAAALVVIASVASLVIFQMSPREIVSVHGMAFIDYDVASLLALFATMVVGSALLVALPGQRYYRALRSGKPAMQADRVLVNAGLLGMLFLALASLTITLKVEILLLLTFVPLLAQLALLLLGAITVDHPDRAIMRRPLSVLTRSLLAKAVALNMMIFWLLAFLVLAVSTSYFVSNSLSERKDGLRRDVLYFAKSYSGFSMTFLEETAHLAALPSMAQMAGDLGEMTPEIREFLDRGGSKRIIRIVDKDGIVRFSSHDEAEVGRHMAASRVLERALLGHKVAAIEKEDLYGLWMVRAAAPIRAGDGLVGVLLETEARSIFDFSDYDAVSPIRAAGWGFISQYGDAVYTYGRQFDAVTRLAVTKALGDDRRVVGETSDESLYFVERAYATDGTPNGFFYIHVTREMMDREVFRILSVVTLVTVLAVLLMTAVVLFGLVTVLRPIKDLRAAAGRIEGGDYRTRIVYHSPDELGQLAEAFNRMSGTIEDRTRELEEALREERDFIDHTVLELRTPLNIFRWTLELMRYGDTGQLNREQLELLEQMHQTNGRIVRLVRNFSMAAQIVHGKLPLNIGPLALEDLVDDVAGALSVDIRRKNINLHWNRPTQPLPEAMADRAHLAEAINHLVGNAIKYTPVNGHVEITAAPVSERDEDGRKRRFIRVAVEDNGRGIHKDDQEKVFHRFFRGRNATAEEIEGTGLGLYIAKNLIEIQGGRVWFESKEGVGTTFYFTIPTEH